MVNHTREYAPILQRAVQAYDGLIELYKQDVTSNAYFDGCLGEARTKRNGLLERLANPAYLADAFKDNYFQSIDQFLESHRGEYGPDMPNPNPEKARMADRHLQNLRSVMEDIIRVGKEQETSS